MKKTKLYIITGFVILFGFATKAQTVSLTLPYYTGFDNSAEQFGWQQFKLGVNATYGPWKILGGGFSAPNQLFHDYNNTDTVEDWYVSPALNFTSASKIALKIKAYAVNGPVSSDYFGIWLGTGSASPAVGTYTEVVNLSTIASYTSQWIDTTINLPFTAGPGYIAFKYVNVWNWFTIGIDNINITDLTAGASEIENENSFAISPNPSTGKFFINSTRNLRSVEIFNVLGEKIYSDSKVSLQSSYEIDLSNYPKGIYFVKLVLSGVEGSVGTNSYTQKIIVQ